MICTRLHSGLHLSCQCVFVRESLTLSTCVHCRASSGGLLLAVIIYIHMIKSKRSTRRSLPEPEWARSPFISEPSTEPYLHEKSNF